MALPAIEAYGEMVAFEVVTFPIPTQPIIYPVNPVFPDGQERSQMKLFRHRI